MSEQLRNFLILGWLLFTAGLSVFWWALVPLEKWNIAQTTLLFGGLSGLIAVPIGFSLSWAQFRIQSFWVTLAFLFIISLIWIPLHLHVAVWDSALGKLGWLRRFGNDISAPLSGMTLAIVVQSLASIPWAAIFGAIAVRSLGTDHEQVALLDGNRIQVMLRVTLRRWLPFVVIALLWNMVVANREIAISDIYQIGTFAEEVYLQFSGGRFDWYGIDPSTGEPTNDYGIAPYWLLTIWLVATSMICLAWVSPRIRFNQTNRGLPKLPRLQRHLLAAWVLALSATLILVPIINLVVRSGQHTVLVDGKPSTRFSLEHFLATFYGVFPGYWEEISWSLTLGIGTAIVVTLVMATGFLVLRNRSLASIAALVLASLSLATPGPVVGAIVAKTFVSFDLAWVRKIYNTSILGPLISTSFISIGIAVLVLFFVFRQVSRESIEAGQIDGASFRESVFRNAMGQRFLGIGLCGLICFLVGFGDLSASYIPMPPGMDTLSRSLLGQMHAGVNDMTAMLSLVSWLFSGTLSMTAVFLIARMTAREKQ